MQLYAIGRKITFFKQIVDIYKLCNLCRIILHSWKSSNANGTTNGGWIGLKKLCKGKPNGYLAMLLLSPSLTHSLSFPVESE